MKATLAEDQAAHAQRKDLEELRGLAAGTELLTQPAEIQQVLDLMQTIASRHSDEPEFQAVVESVARRVKSVTMSRPSAIIAPTIAIAPRPVAAAIPPVVPPPVSSPVSSPVSPQRSPAGNDGATNIFFGAGPVEAAPTPVPAPKVAVLPPSWVPILPAQPVAKPPSAPNDNVDARSTSPKEIPWAKAVAAAALLLILVALATWFATRSKKTREVPAPLPALVNFTVHTEPAGAIILRGAERIGTSDAPISLPPANYQLTVQKEGYQSVSLAVSLASGTPAPYQVALKPLPAVLKLFTPFKSGEVFLDGKAVNPLAADGQFTLSTVDWGKHAIRIESGGTAASINFEIAAQALPVLHQPETSGDVDAVAVAVLKDKAVVACSSEISRLCLITRVLGCWCPARPA